LIEKEIFFNFYSKYSTARENIFISFPIQFSRSRNFEYLISCKCDILLNPGSKG
jgi:hypothetical protein